MSSSSQSQQKYQPSNVYVSTNKNFTEEDVEDGVRRYGSPFRQWVAEGKVLKVVRVPVEVKEEADFQNVEFRRTGR